MDENPTVRNIKLLGLVNKCQNFDYHHNLAIYQVKGVIYKMHNTLTTLNTSLRCPPAPANIKTHTPV
jgi:hypothetical protein